VLRPRIFAGQDGSGLPSKLCHQVDSKSFAALVAPILDSGKQITFRAHGKSMLPFIRDGDAAVVEPIDNVPSTIRLGDVVLCTIGEGRLLVHRVTRINNSDSVTMYRIQGNAMSKPDGLIASGQILGRVIRIERGANQRQIDTPWERILGTLWIWASPWTRRSYKLISRIFA
jgi:hypothetical protein